MQLDWKRCRLEKVVIIMPVWNRTILIPLVWLVLTALVSNSVVVVTCSLKTSNTCRMFSAGEHARNLILVFRSSVLTLVLTMNSLILYQTAGTRISKYMYIPEEFLDPKGYR